MPSRTDSRWPRVIEHICRATVLALVVWCIVSTFRGRSDSGHAVIDDRELRTNLAAWTLRGSREPLHLRASASVPPVERAWLRALARSGHVVTWEGRREPLALATEPVREPRRGHRLLVAAPNGTRIELDDDVGSIDTLTVVHLGAELRTPSVVGMARARAGTGTATAMLADSAALRSVVVLGRASWETRFVVAALEESGWSVSVRTPLAPGLMVEQGPATLDTSRVSAVVALDSTAAPYASAILRYVRDGGGLVLGASAAASVATLRELAPALPGAVQQPVITPLGDSLDRRALGLHAVQSLRPGAVAVERRGASIAVAARRAGAGRVVQQGYLESWRWRLSGGDDGVDGHRRWWSSLVGSAAYAQRVPQRAPAPVDPAPYAATVHALGYSGAPTRATDSMAGLPAPGLGTLAVILMLLLVEWFSRRLRGVA